MQHKLEHMPRSKTMKEKQHKNKETKENRAQKNDICIWCIMLGKNMVEWQNDYAESSTVEITTEKHYKKYM